MTSAKLLAWALEQAAQVWETEAEATFADSRRMRAAQAKDEHDDIVGATPEDMYNLGYAEGQHGVLRSAADKLRTLIGLLRADA